MGKFEFEKLEMEGVYLINSFFEEDNRGSFIKNFERNIYLKNGIDFFDNEDFITQSTKYVIRGMHFQTTNPQAKLVSVITGKVYDVIVDLRRESKTFGKWAGYYLSNENRNSLYIPKGFAHGFISLSDNSLLSYKCDAPYDSKSDTGIKFDDKDIGIIWPTLDTNNITISHRDRNFMTFKEFKENFGGF